MTATLVVRLSKKEIATLDAAAKKRSQSRSVFVRQLLREGTAKAADSRVDWSEHIEWQKKHGQKVDWSIVSEARKERVDSAE